MLGAALKQPDPVLIFEHQTLYNLAGEAAPPPSQPIDITRAAVRRTGSAATIVTYGAGLHKSLAAAEALAGEGLDVEVIDLRVLRPLDDATIMQSVAKTHRVLVVDEAWRSGGISAEIAARIMEQAFFDLDGPVARLCGAEVPMPYAKHLEYAALPQPETIVAAVQRLVNRNG
jgi:pyruvate dehydrogenase E1 component beta subunit